MRALVTGAGGFVGANLVRSLLSAGHEPVAWVRPGGDHWRLADVADHAEIRELDLLDEAAMGTGMRSAKPDWIFHLAAHGAYSWQRELEQIVQVNLVATTRLLTLAAAHECAAFVHAGSSSEYGFQDHAPSETDPVEPNSDYATMKAAATLHCRSFAQRHDLHVVTLRLYSVYGPWEEPGRLMPKLVARGLQGELPPLVAPDTARDFVTARDVERAFLLAAQRPDLERGTVLNIGSGVQTTLHELVAVARAHLGIEALPRWETEPARSWDTSMWVSDPRRAREQLGWVARDDVAQGFADLSDWLSRRRDLWSRYGIAVAE